MLIGMLGAIVFPQWLLDIWAVYGDVITPILVTIVAGAIGILGVMIKRNLVQRIAEGEQQIGVLRQISNREDTRPEINSLREKIEVQNNSILELGNMINIFLQNTNLSDEDKAQVSTILERIKFGTAENLIDSLKNENTRLSLELEQLQSNTTETISVVPTETESTHTAKKHKKRV